MSPEQQKQWMAQWKGAAIALEKVREEELALLSDEDAAQAVQAILEGPGAELASERKLGSGLVMQQQLFAKARRP